MNTQFKIDSLARDAARFETIKLPESPDNKDDNKFDIKDVIATYRGEDRTIPTIKYPEIYSQFVYDPSIDDGKTVNRMMTFIGYRYQYDGYSKYIRLNRYIKTVNAIQSYENYTILTLIEHKYSIGELLDKYPELPLPPLIIDGTYNGLCKYDLYTGTGPDVGRTAYVNFISSTSGISYAHGKLFIEGYYRGYNDFAGIILDYNMGFPTGAKLLSRFLLASYKFDKGGYISRASIISFQDSIYQIINRRGPYLHGELYQFYIGSQLYNPLIQYLIQYLITLNNGRIYGKYISTHTTVRQQRGSDVPMVKTIKTITEIDDIKNELHDHDFYLLTERGDIATIDEKYYNGLTEYYEEHPDGTRILRDSIRYDHGKKQGIETIYTKAFPVGDNLDITPVNDNPNVKYIIKQYYIDGQQITKEQYEAYMNQRMKNITPYVSIGHKESLTSIISGYL
jgi:hypothetical protein